MEEIMRIRMRLIEIYKRYEDVINIAAKFIAGLLVFYIMSDLSMGGVTGLRKAAIILLGAIITTFSSASVFIVVCALGAVVFIGAASIETAIVALMVFFLLYVFYGRIFPKESVLFIAMLVCFKIKLPYVIPILGGLYFGAGAIFPAAAAMFVNQFALNLGEVIKMAPTSEFSASTMPDNLFNMYTYIFTDAAQTFYGCFFSAAAIAVAVIAAWAISNMSIDHEKEIAIIVSAIVMIIGLFLAVILGGSDFSVFGLPVCVAISAVIVYAIRLFDDLPDYRHTERVQFQDKNYFYYVKAVPKIGTYDTNQRAGIHSDRGEE